MHYMQIFNRSFQHIAGNTTIFIEPDIFKTFYRAQEVDDLWYYRVSPTIQSSLDDPDSMPFREFTQREKNRIKALELLGEWEAVGNQIAGWPDCFMSLEYKI